MLLRVTARSALLLLLTAAACDKRPEPVPEAKPTTENVARSWFSLTVPARSIAGDPSTPEQRAVVELVVDSPPKAPHLRLIVQRPLSSTSDLATWVTTSKGQLALTGGLGADVRAEADDTIDGLASKRVELRMTLQGVSVNSVNWYYVKDGSTGALLCSSKELGMDETRDRCRAMVSSFRFTAPLPRSDVAAVGADQTLTLAGYTLTVPAGWQALDQSPVASAAFTVRAAQPLGSQFPTVMLVVEPFKGTLTAYDKKSDAELADAGLGTGKRQPAKFLAAPALEFETVWPTELGGHQTLQYEAVKDGKGYVFTCSGAPETFATLRETCRKIAGSLRVGG